MNGIKTGTIGVLVAVAIGAGMFAIRKRSEVRQTEANHADLTKQQTRAEVEMTRLETQLKEQTTRADALEAQNVTLRDTLARAKVAQKPPPLTRQAVEERIRATRELVRSGNPAEALRELLWGLDEGLKHGDSATEPAKRSMLMSSFRDLADVYPPAREELRKRRDAVRRRILANAGGRDFVAEYAGILRALKEEQSVLSLLDEIPAGDPRRTTVAIYASEQLIAAKRYAEAMEGRQAATLFSGFETKSRMGIIARSGPEGGPSSLAISTARDIELLAGSGDVANARELAKRLLAIDSSESTKALIQKHAERAGQPELLSGSNP